MLRRALLVVAAVVLCGLLSKSADAQQPRAYGQTWGGSYSNQDWNRFYHYPYVYYPQNFRGPDYYRSSNSMYHRYPSEMQIPVYNKKWHNAYPAGRRYHMGNHFRTDVF